MGGFKIGGKNFANGTAIIAETQEELQDMLNRLVDTRRECSMEINIDNQVENRELKEVDRFKYL